MGLPEPFDTEVAEDVLEQLCRAKRPVIYAGTGIRLAGAMEEFRKAYDAIEDGDEKLLTSLKKFFSFKSTSSKAEKQASLISSFSVPCTKEDLHEFLLLSATHFDPEFLALTEAPDGMFFDDFNDEMLLQKAWFAKFQQVYEMAKTSFRKDPHFQRFQEIYDQKMGEVQKRKKKPLIKKEFLIMAALMLVMMMLMIVFGRATGFIKDDDAASGQETVETEEDGWEEQEDLI